MMKLLNKLFSTFAAVILSALLPLSAVAESSDKPYGGNCEQQTSLNSSESLSKAHEDD